MKIQTTFRSLLALLLIFPFLQTAPVRANLQPSDPEPVVARVYYTGQADLAYLAGRLDIWEVHPEQGYLVALLSPQTFTELTRQGFILNVDPELTAEVRNRPLLSEEAERSGVSVLPCYRTVEETERDIQRLANLYPGLAHLEDIGDSWQKTISGGTSGYDLSTVVLTNHYLPGPKTRFFLVGAVHAREMATAETAARFAEDLIAMYGIDPDVTWLLDTTEVHILPIANPDGRKIAEQGWYWRKNVDNDDGCTSSMDWGVDLNRNSSFQWGGAGASPYPCSELYRGPGPASEPEVQAIQNYASGLFPDQRGPAVSDPAPDTTQGLFISLHSYGDLVLWPWGWTSDGAPNAEGLETLGSKLAFFNGYAPGQSYTLYPTSGDTDDWMYGELGVPAYTFELGNDFFQDCATFENRIYPDNRRALLYALKAARQPYLEPGGPEITSIQFEPPVVISGQPLTVTAIADDTRFRVPVAGAGQPIMSARLALAPPWQSEDFFELSPLDGAWDNPVETVSASLDTTGWLTGRSLLFIDAVDFSGSRGVPTGEFVCVSAGISALEASATPEGKTLYPGESNSFQLKIINRGIFTDTYHLDWQPNLWQVAGPDLTARVPPCGQTEVSFLVAAPHDIPPDDLPPLILSVTPGSDLTASVPVTLTERSASPLTAAILPSGYQDGALPGQPVTYQLGFTNHGTVTETLQVHLSQEKWPVTVSPTLTLSAGQIITVPLSVTPPPAAAPGDSDTVHLELIRSGEEQPQISFSLITQVGWRRYMPLIR